MSYGAFKPAAANPADLLAELQPPKAKKQPFVPGKRGVPRSGMSAHDILNDPGHLRKIAALVDEHQAVHGSKKLKGPQVKGMLEQVVGDVSDAQARTVARRLNKLMMQSIKA